MNKTVKEYKDLNTVISGDMWAGFDFSEYYAGEQKILKPAMEKAGYINVRFEMGERDSFGPLSRIVIANKDGKTEYFIYG